MPGARRRLGRRGPRSASSSTMCAVTSALGGSVTAPKSQNGSLRGSALVLSASNAAQPPSLDCMPSDQARPRSAAPRVVDLGAPQREHDDGGVVDVGVVVVRELEREAAGRRGRAAHRPVAAHAHLAAGEPLRRRARPRRAPASRPASSSASTRERRVPHRRLARLDAAALARPRS